MKLFARILSIIVLVVTLFSSSVKPLLAMSYGQYITDVYVPAVYTDPNINLQKHIKETIATVPIAIVDTTISLFFPPGLSILTCINLNNFTFNPADAVNLITTCFTTIRNNADLSKPGPLANNPVVEKLASTGGNIFPMPMSGVSYVQESLRNFKIIPQAHAQGYGLYSLSTTGGVILLLWRGIRNIAYLLSAIILIILGILIMFRVKISPQAVITIEQAIPKLAATLLLITFSYAIVGFMIDLTYVALYLFAILVNSLNIPWPGVIQSVANTVLGTFGLAVIPDWFHIALPNFYVDPAALTGGAANTLVSSLWAILFVAIDIFGFIGAFGGIGLLGSVVGLIMWIVVIIVLIFNIFRLWWGLLHVYANFVITIITAPLWILMGLIPGSNIGFGSWLNNLLENLFVFPAVTMMFVLGLAFIVAGSGGGAGTGGWVPPQILSESGGGIGLVFVGIAILFAIPSAPKMVKAFFAKKPFDFESAVGESVKPVSTLVKTPIAGAADYASKSTNPTTAAIGSAIKYLLGK